MINKIISAICLALKTEYGQGYKIYKESIEQGLQEPCFFVSVIVPLRERHSPKRFRRDVTITIQYFPEDKENYYAEDNAVIERLYDVIELISIDDEFIRGADFDSTISDEGVLTFQATYTFFEYNPELEVEMENLEQHTGTKEVENG